MSKIVLEVEKEQSLALLDELMRTLATECSDIPEHIRDQFFFLYELKDAIKRED